MAKRIAIIGGGITGLTAAYRLEQLIIDAKMQDHVRIDLYESSDKLGGKIGTHRVEIPPAHGSFLFENGPDCFYARKSGAIELVEELGLADEIIEPLAKEFAMYVMHQLHRVPEGLVSFTYSQPDAVLNADFLSAECKQRVLEEPQQPSGTAEDESIRSFFTRRFGSEFCRLVVEPLLAGTHGGSADKLSMKALYPGYFFAERQSGSIQKGMVAARDANLNSVADETSPKFKSSFLSFKNGMETLIQGLTRNLKFTQIHLNSSIRSLKQVQADKILIAIPANSVSNLLEESEPIISEMLRPIEHASSAIVHFVGPRGIFPSDMNYTGFLVPKGQAPQIVSHQSVSRLQHAQDHLGGTNQTFEITGATWSSEKWENRAPEGWVNMRVFLGGNRPAFADTFDSELVTIAKQSIQNILHLSQPITVVEVRKWRNALPQYMVGHSEKMDRLDEHLRKQSKIFLAGTSYRGVGIPDCIRQGNDIAIKIIESL